MKKSAGLSLVEVLVAIAILAILGVSLVSLLPGLSRNTRASSVDTVQIQRIQSVFERIAVDWTNQTQYLGDRLSDGTLVVDFVAAQVGGGCTAAITQPSAERKRVVVSCPQGDGLPLRTLRAEFGDPGEAEE